MALTARKNPGAKGTVIQLEEARARLRARSLHLALSCDGHSAAIENAVTFDCSEEPTEQLLRFHPVFRYWLA